MTGVLWKSRRSTTLKTGSASTRTSHRPLDVGAPSPLTVAGSGTIFFTEGGSETEIMYRHGFALPEFAMFPLLNIPIDFAALHDMFRAQLDVAAEFGFGFLLSGLD